MTTHAAVAAVVGLALMLAVGAAYVALARRFRALWHPLSIVLAVGIVSVVVAVLGALFNGGSAAVPAMLRRSAIGGFGWGAIIAVVVTIARRAIGAWRQPRA